MILKVSRGGRIVGKNHESPAVDISDQAIEYLFERVELDPDVTLKDIFLILKRNPILLKVFRRLRAEELVDTALAERPEETPGYGVENMEYLELSWGWNPGQGGDLVSIWPKMSLCGVGYELREPLQTEYETLPVGTRQSWALEFCSAKELISYPVRIDSEIRMKPGGRPKLIDLGLPDLGKVIEGGLYCLSWFGSEEDREGIKAELLQASAATELHEELDPDDLIAELGMMLASIDEKGDQQI